MRLLDRYLAKEILLPTGAAVLFVSQLLLATQLLAEASVLFGAGVSLSDAAVVALALLPGLVAFVLPIGFLLGAVVGLGRLAEDRELIALSAAGISPARLVRVPLAVAACLAVLGLGLAAFGEPAALALAHERVVGMLARNLAGGVQPGMFYDQLPGYTLFAGRVDGRRWEHVLVSDESDAGAPVLALAAWGELDAEAHAGELRLVLADGDLHRADDEAYVVAAFTRAELAIRLGESLLRRTGLARGAREAAMLELPARARRERLQGELDEARRDEASFHRRIAQALAVLPFALLSVPLAALRHAGRALALAASLGAVVLHYVLLRGGQVAAQRGTLPAALALELSTLVLSVVAIALLVVLERRGVGARR